jgi:hypothetical protein
MILAVRPDDRMSCRTTANGKARRGSVRVGCRPTHALHATRETLAREVER